MALESAITSEPSTNTGTWRWPDSRNKASWPKPGVTSTTVYGSRLTVSTRRTFSQKAECRNWCSCIDIAGSGGQSS